MCDVVKAVCCVSFQALALYPGSKLDSSLSRGLVSSSHCLFGLFFALSSLLCYSTQQWTNNLQPARVGIPVAEPTSQ